MNKLRLPWGDKDDRYIFENYSSQDMKEIAKVLHRTPNSIKQRAYVIGVGKRPASRKWGKLEIDYLRKHFPCSTKEVILKGLDRNWTAIRTKAVKLKIKRINRFRMPNGINNYFFENWSQDMAYALGFIAADGNVSKEAYKLGIKLAIKDFGHLCLLRDLIAPKNTVYETKCKKAASLEICSKYLCLSLMNLGIIPRKSLVLEFPGVPEKYISHFVRGYFDGDGCISKSNKSKCWESYFLGTRPFLETINTYLSDHDIIDRKNIIFVRQSNIYKLKYSTYDSIKIGKWMYKGSTIHLGRKYNKFKKLFEERTNR